MSLCMAFFKVSFKAIEYQRYFIIAASTNFKSQTASQRLGFFFIPLSHKQYNRLDPVTPVT